MLGDNQTVKVAAIQSTLDENMQFSDYFVGLDGPADLRYGKRLVYVGSTLIH